jgi:AcrR family transcriptional regulator
MIAKTADTDRELKRERLVTAAAQVFATRGYRNATMDEIAQAGGTAKGTLYLYFKDKEALFYAVFQWLTAQMLDRDSQFRSGDASASQRLRALAEAAAHFMDENRAWFPLTLEVWAAAGSTDSRQRFAIALREMYAQYRVVIADIIRTGQECGELRADLDADALGAVLTGAMDGLLLQCWFDPSLDPLPLLRGFFDPLLCGMQARNQGEKA